ncbi:glycoside hydrolase family 15 protein [Ktedonosporobacter rubrisoli]|uniref:Glycoside hydrolase family 15 protein n=1 Tax=Ktedonosporobacter rubrisoli TaxID=2509675 RepID=A0A4P6JRG9_KTERU|nr:glycoside hydrolase family 15 protein [Ktedonosporobacter rubrisoli]QBD78058.1 glycoside hydrolase family 15 protein [Ktedonosporobacter rubrisoli]
MLTNQPNGVLSPSSPYQPIEDYAIIGDLHTVALVGKNGSIDWCCLPRFDSPSVFGALLDVNKGGYFRISPPETPGMSHKQIYLPETNILITRFLTVDGVAEITDFMPIKQDNNRHHHQHHIVRSVSVVRGSLNFEMVCRPAFNYARDQHAVIPTEYGALFHSADLRLGLVSSVPIELDGKGGVCANFTLREGQSARFILEGASNNEITLHEHSLARYQEEFQKTRSFWQSWLAQCQYQGRWREMVQRSALVLKLLTYAPTGAIVAAPTTSLPETLGGNRNWDYRYTWLRDSAFTLFSLLTLGFTQEAEAFMGWLDARCHELKDNGTLQPMYTIDGKHDLTEFTLDHLEGYRQSAPVRIGNGAYKQKQLDIYGELMDAIYIYNRYAAVSYDLWQSIRRQLNWLSTHWQEPDEGIWEVRGGPKPFVHSRLMSWVAFDRGLRLSRHRGLPAPLVEWTRASADIYEEIMAKGWNEKKKSFVQYYGSNSVDASALLMVITKFAGPRDPRILHTVERIQKELCSDSLVHRYNPLTAANDGLGSIEGTFSMCSFWLAETLARAGRLEEARLMLEKMLSYSNHVGLYAEEIGPTGEALGNFPQAFTHLSLITACYTIDQALNKTHTAPDWNL